MSFLSSLSTLYNSILGSHGIPSSNSGWAPPLPPQTIPQPGSQSGGSTSGDQGHEASGENGGELDGEDGDGVEGSGEESDEDDRVMVVLGGFKDMERIWKF